MNFERCGTSLIVLWLTLIGCARLCNATESSGVDVEVLDRIRSTVFPTKVESVGQTQAIHIAKAGYHFESLDEVNLYNVSSQHLLPNSAHVLSLAEPPLESLEAV